jgi:S-formylglutathione hydrolase FrmB
MAIGIDGTWRRAVRRRRAIAIVALLAAGLVAWRLVATAIAPDTRGARVEHLTIESKAVGRALPVTVVVPGGDSARRGLVVFLHGRAGNQDSELNDQFFTALAGVGARAPVIAFPYGGDHSYWHDRADGNWGDFIVDEAIPRVERDYGTDPRRVAIGGISMGGFGAFDAVLHHPEEFCAVGGHSPAVWQTGAETAAGAFDDAQDFARNDVVGAVAADPSIFAGKRFWLDAGVDDPFQLGDRALVDALRAGGVGVERHLSWPGGHESGYWNSHWAPYLRFYASALKHCR